MNHPPVAIITGAGRGIGRSLAFGLAELGYLTVLIGRSLDPLEDTARAMISEFSLPDPVHPRVVRLDLSDIRVAQETVARLVYEMGRLDVLVNNAGQWIAGTHEPHVDDYRRLMDINLVAPVALVQAVVETMKQQGHGYIFNIASRAGKVGFPNAGAYCATKFAMVGWSESVYRELVPLGIKVTAICPGWVNTEMADQGNCSYDRSRIIQPEDLKATMQWLLRLSPGASVREIVMESPESLVP